MIRLALLVDPITMKNAAYGFADGCLGCGILTSVNE